MGNDLLAITKNSDWIVEREKLWKPIGDDFKKDFRKKEIEKIHHYFMTGSLRDGEALIDGAKFYWFPIKTPEGWDYVLQHLIEKAKSFEEIFYDSFESLERKGFSDEEENILWDYFLGDSFQQTITSRVPISKSGKKLIVNVNKDDIAVAFESRIGAWLCGNYVNSPKWVKRFNYYLTLLMTLEDSHFLTDDNGGLKSDSAYFSKLLMTYVFNAPLGEDIPLNEEGIQVRKNFLENFRQQLDAMNMPPLMKKTWEDVKAQYRA